MLFHVSNIEWDIDNIDDFENLNLPSKIKIEAEDKNLIADRLSDFFVFCVKSFSVN